MEAELADFCLFSFRVLHELRIIRISSVTSLIIKVLIILDLRLRDIPRNLINGLDGPALAVHAVSFPVS